MKSIAWVKRRVEPCKKKKNKEEEEEKKIKKEKKLNGW